MTTLEISLLWGLCLVAGALGGAVVEVWRLHRTSMAAWMAQAAAQKEAYEARQALAEANKRLGALQATRGEVLEAAIGAAKLASLDALQQPPVRGEVLGQTAAKSAFPADPAPRAS